MALFLCLERREIFFVVRRDFKHNYPIIRCLLEVDTMNFLRKIFLIPIIKDVNLMIDSNEVNTISTKNTLSVTSFIVSVVSLLFSIRLSLNPIKIYEIISSNIYIDVYSSLSDAAIITYFIISVLLSLVSIIIACIIGDTDKPITTHAIIFSILGIVISGISTILALFGFLYSIL